MNNKDGKLEGVPGYGEPVFKVVEQFLSINGEGRRAGQLALFVRFAGCNLNCEYCDTRWANERDASYDAYTCDLLYEMITGAGINNITLTGGEPLLQQGIGILLDHLRTERRLNIEIETNGSIDIEPFFTKREDFISDNVTFTLDYKTGASGMESRMCMHNYELVRDIDTVKFVVGSVGDIETAVDVIKKYRLKEKGCGIFISPCFGKIEPREIVEYMVKNRINDVNVQLQLHKYIWDPDRRGV